METGRSWVRKRYRPPFLAIRHQPPGPLRTNSETLGGDDLPVPGVAPSAEHHVAEHEAPTWSEPSKYLPDDLRLVGVAEVMEGIVRHHEVDRAGLEVELLDRDRLSFHICRTRLAGVVEEEVDHLLADVDGEDRRRLLGESECHLAGATSQIDCSVLSARIRFVEDSVHDLHEAGIVAGAVVPADGLSGPETLLSGDVAAARQGSW